MLRQEIFLNGTPSHPLPANLQRIIQNSQQIFHIDPRVPSDLDRYYVCETRRALSDRLIVVTRR